MIVPFEPHHAKYVCSHLSEYHKAEFYEQHWAAEVDNFLHILAQDFIDYRGIKYSLVDDNEVYGIGGYEVIGPCVLTAWGAGTEKIWDKIIEYTRTVKRLNKELIERDMVNRIQVVTMDRKSRRWFEAMGFKEEGDLGGYGRSGNTFKIYGMS